MKSTKRHVLYSIVLFLILTLIYPSQSFSQLVSVNIGRDTTLPLKQSSATTLTLTPSVSILGVPLPLTYTWTQVSGPAVTIQLPTQLNTDISGFVPGHYSFRCVVSDGTITTNDVINVKVVDYQKKNQIPCRAGAPVTWVLSATNTTDLYQPYLRRGGRDIQGGDTIKINRNPNNGGVYNRIYLGDFGGDEGCPVVVVPNGQIVEIGGAGARWFLGNNTTIADTNFVNHVVFDGTYLRNQGIEYGFQSTGTGFGMGTRMVTDLEIKGCLFANNSLGIQMKILSDSTYPWTVYDNFKIKNIKIHDNYFMNIAGSEGLYLGHTDPSGTTQAGNDGPVPRMDTVLIYNNIFNGTTWDPIQTSSARYVEIHDNIVMNGSVINQSSQNWGILMGANCTGKIYNNVMYNGKGGSVGTLGYGPVEIYYNFIDSTMGGAGTSDGIYADMKSNYILESDIPALWPNLRMNIHHNIVSRFERNAIFNADNENTTLPGSINDNYIIEPTRSLSSVVRSNAGDAMVNNTIVRSFPVLLRDIGNPAIGPRIEVTQGPAVDTFSTSKDIIDWLFARLTGTAPNMPPNANAGNDQTITLPVNSTTLNGGTSNDPDGTITSYAWTKVAGPAQGTITTPGAAQTTITNLVQGTYRFELRVTDNSGATDVDTVSVTVNPAAPPNQPPVANAGTDQTITLPTNTVTLTGSGTDADGTISSYAWTKISGPTTFNIASPSAAQTQITNLVQGTYQFRLLVTDNLGATDADTVSVTVNAATPPPNQAPTANAGADHNITLPNNTVTLTGSGTDTDGTISSYSWTKIAGPTQFTIVSGTTAQTAVNNLVQGVYQFRLLVTDNQGATDADTVSVTVNAATPPPNQAPNANAGADHNITLPNNTVTLTGSGTDTDGTISSYSWTKIAGPTQFTIVSGTSAQTAVNNLVQGVYQFRLLVTDNQGATDADTVSVTVNAAVPPPNQTPNANAGPDLNITLPNNAVTVTGSGTDTDGSITSYAWTKISGPAQFTIVSAASAQTNITNLVQGIYQFRLLVTDNQGATDADTMIVTVNAATPPPNQPPVANAGPDQNITLPNNAVTLTGAGTDADGIISGYSWAYVSGPAQYTIVNGTNSQTAITNLVQGVYQFSLTVTDNLGATNTDIITVTVNAAPPNQPPVANAGNALNITLPNNTVLLSGSGTDADGTVAGYNWTKIAGPAQFTITNPSAAQTTVTALAQGVYQFRLQVTDDQGANGYDTVAVTVNAAPVPNIPPVANAGNAQSITLPINSVVLTGGGTDIDGTIVSYRWNRLTGGAATIISPTQASTVVAGLVQGNYSFELVVTDDDGAIGSDTVYVTVVSASNLMPLANAGNDRVITLPINSTDLQGTASDPDGSITNMMWREITGRPQFNLSNPSSTQTNVTNLAEGIYKFEFSATDNSGATARDTVTVEVKRVPDSKAMLYPNPAGSRVTLQIDANTLANQTSVIIYDANGKQVYRTQFARTQLSMTKELEIDNLTPGIYYVEVAVDINKKVTLKLYKK